MTDLPKLPLLAGVVFLVSFALPAYAGSTGFQCFGACWDVLWDFQRHADNPLRWLYYSAFVPTNLLFVILLGCALCKSGYTKTRFTLSAALFFHVLSWLLVNLSKEKLGHLELQPGYYVWLSAFILLVASHFVLIPPDPAPVNTDALTTETDPATDAPTAV